MRETKHLSTDADSSTDAKKILLLRKIRQRKKKILHGDFTPFISKSFQIWDHFCPLSHYITFSKVFWKSKKFGNLTFGSGGKKPFKQCEQRRRKKIRNFFFVNRPYESIGPEGRCFENIEKNWGSAYETIIKQSECQNINIATQVKPSPSF